MYHIVDIWTRMCTWCIRTITDSTGSYQWSLTESFLPLKEYFFGISVFHFKKTMSENFRNDRPFKTFITMTQTIFIKHRKHFLWNNLTGSFHNYHNYNSAQTEKCLTKLSKVNSTGKREYDEKIAATKTSWAGCTSFLESANQRTNALSKFASKLSNQQLIILQYSAWQGV